MVVGLTEYLRKWSMDIFLFVVKVVFIIGEIHKAVFIIIYALVRVLYRWIFYACSLICLHWNSLSTKEADKKGLSPSLREIPLQNQGQWMLSSLLKPMHSVTSNIYNWFDTIRKFFLVSTPLLNRYIETYSSCSFEFQLVFGGGER